MQQNIRQSNGFTLIELAISFTIIGLIIAGFAAGYRIYLEEKFVAKQEKNFNTIRNALATASLNGIKSSHGIDLDDNGNFSGTNERTFSAADRGRILVEKIDNNNDGDYTDAGDSVTPIADYNSAAANSTIVEYYYFPQDEGGNAIAHGQPIYGYAFPCPAPLNNGGTPGVPYTNAGPTIDLPSPFDDDLPKGEATDCDASSLTDGWNVGEGVYKVEGINGGEVIIGAVPYRALNIPESVTLDAQNNKIFYAISTNMTVTGASLSSTGAQIEVKPNAAITTGDGDLAQFALFSAGPDGAGAWTKAGNEYGVDCPTSGVQRQNCDFTDGVDSSDAASFLIMSQADSNDDDERFDDTIAFTFTDGAESNFFTRGAASSGVQFDIVNKTPGDLLLSKSLIANETLKAQNSASIGTNTNNTTLDVGGEIKVGMTGTDTDTASQLACNTNTAGAIRYNNETKCVEFCDSNDWQPACEPGCLYNGARVDEGYFHEDPPTSVITSSGCNAITTTTTVRHTCEGSNAWTESSSQQTNTDSSGCRRKEKTGDSVDSNGDGTNDTDSRW